MTDHAGAKRARSRRGLAGSLGALVVAEVVLGLVLSAMAGWGWQQMLDGFVVTNGLMGVTFGLCGAVIAWHRPSNPIGWLFIADGIGHATTTFAGPLAPVLAEASAPLPAQRLVVTVAMLAWPWSIGLFLPLALLLFPTGRPLSPRWRWVSLGIIVTAPLFVLEMVGSGEPISNGLPRGYLTIPSYDELQPLWTATELRNLIAIVLAIACLVIRFRRADEVGRRQLLWLLLASVVVLLFITPWGLIAGTPIFVLLAIPLIPIAVAVAIVRHQLLDIRLVVSRALTWGLLTLVAIACYAGLAAVLGALIPSRVGRSAAVTVLVALIIAPILPRLQKLVDRALYGDRHDPARIASRVGAQLSAGLPGVVAAIRSGLRFPYTALAVDGTVIASDGTAPESVVPLELEYGGTPVAQLLIGVRSGESALSAADRDVLALVAVPLAVAVHATRLSNELQSSREKLVAAREEERRRIRRDLHDGLGPTLTGVAFTADAAANLIDSDTAKARDLITTLRTDTRTAIADVRRLVDDLRPPALDELGLVGALQQRADQLTFRADGASIQVEVAAEGLPALPAALEVAAYRIATEALTNVVRHSNATSAVLALRCGNDLEVEVTDDGPPNGAWRPGVGLHAMRERAAELGGAFEAGPTPAGGLVRAFPLGRLMIRDASSESAFSGSAPVIRVVLADDHPVVRAGLAALLTSLPGIEVVGVAATGREAVREVVTNRPDVAVLDLQMPDLDGFAATRELARSAPEVAVLVLTMFEDDDSVFAAMRAGARGYLVKGAEQDEIARAIRAVAAGEAIFGPGVARRVLGFFAAPTPAAAEPFPELTSREREILNLLAAGLSNPAIGDRLHLASKTVANNVSAIFTKLGIADRATAIIQARNAGLGTDQG